MFDFGEELTIESYRIPWLIWIQILILFLLIFLLYCFSIVSLDPSPHNGPSFASPSTAGLSGRSIKSQLDKPVPKHNFSTAVVTTRLHNTRVGEIQSIKAEVAASTSRTVVRGEDMTEREGSSSKDASHINYHPCHYFRLARIAFLKCLGLDNTSESPSGKLQQIQRDDPNTDRRPGRDQ